VPFFEGIAGRPKPWILGSSPSSAVVAARLGLPYCFAAFLNPTAAQISLATYRRGFQPSRFRAGLAKPHSMLGVNVVCAETEKEALRVQAPGELVRRLAGAGHLPNGVPSAADAIDQLGGPPDSTRYVPGSWPRTVAAAPARLRELLEELHPGRIDLGLGRSSGTDQITSRALRRADEDYPPLLAELLRSSRASFRTVIRTAGSRPSRAWGHAQNMVARIEHV
jgi:alkanesulfonate monooxygenase SsuD/methylene tetrahydromethanopterin reductase-like flavin-dependent oxidoreductase (luciferase family)